MALDNDRLTGLVLKAQERIFRLSARDHGLSLHTISLDSGIPYNTIRSYAGHNGAQSMMPVAAVLKLVGVIPDSLLSQLFQPVTRALVDCTAISDDHDTAGDRCDNVASLVRKARHPASPGGVEIVECEDAEIRRARAECGA